MAVITATSLGTVGGITATKTTLGATDTLTYTKGKNMLLEFVNTTASPVIVTVKGNAATTLGVTGYGNVDLSAGKSITVGGTIGATVVVPLDKISAYLEGTSVAVTGGTGLTAILYTN
jgi:hypothetical protein